MQYEGRIVGVGTSALGGTLRKPYDTTSGAEAPGIMCGYCCTATLPSRQNLQLYSSGDGSHAKSVLEAIHGLELWPVQVSGPRRASVSPPNLEKISSYIIITPNVTDITVQAEMLCASTSWGSHGLFLIVVTVAVPSSEDLAPSIIWELWHIGRGYNVVVVVVQQDDLLNL